MKFLFVALLFVVVCYCEASLRNEVSSATQSCVNTNVGIYTCFYDAAGVLDGTHSRGQSLCNAAYTFYPQVGKSYTMLYPMYSAGSPPTTPAYWTCTVQFSGDSRFYSCYTGVTTARVDPSCPLFVNVGCTSGTYLNIYVGGSGGICESQLPSFTKYPNGSYAPNVVEVLDLGCAGCDGGQS